MQSSPTQTQTGHYQEILSELVDMAADIARIIHKQATKPGETKPIEDPTIPFDRIARTIRKTIALAQALDKPPRPAPDRTAARRKIIRRVEDTIGHTIKVRPAEIPDAEALRAEFRERLDAPEFDHEISTRPIAEIIDEIIHDLGLDPRLGIFRWNRRTPREVNDLNEQAAAPPNPSPKAGHRHREQAWPSQKPLSAPQTQARLPPRAPPHP